MGKHDVKGGEKGSKKGGPGEGGKSGPGESEKGKKEQEAPKQDKGVVGLAEPGPNDVVAKLHLLVDLESRHVGLKELASGDVGHTWVSLEWNDPTAVPVTLPAEHRQMLEAGGKYADPMGFWPDLEGVHTPDGEGVGYKQNPFKSYVQGHMRHPDRGHEGSEKATLTYSLTYKQAQGAIAYAQTKKAAQYSVYFYNCTTFAQKMVSAAGKSAPSMSKGGIALPDAAYDGILKHKAKGGETKDIKGGENSEDFVNQGYIGVKFQQVALPPKLTILLDKPNVLMVTGFEDDSPCTADLKIGDKIAYFNGHRSNSEATIRRGLFGKVNQKVEAWVLDEAVMQQLEQQNIATLKHWKANNFGDVMNRLLDAKEVSVGRPAAKDGKKSKKSKGDSGGKKKAA